MTTIMIPQALAHFTAARTTLESEAETLAEALAKLSEDNDMDDVVLTSCGDLQPYMRVFVDRTIVTVRARSELEAISVRGTTVELKTAFAGG